ncbi:MAG: hypothetical protein AMXMBFR7_43810 [Planctomycetota bacterium]
MGLNLMPSSSVDIIEHDPDNVAIVTIKAGWPMIMYEYVSMTGEMQIERHGLPSVWGGTSKCWSWHFVATNIIFVAVVNVAVFYIMNISSFRFKRATRSAARSA